MATYKSRMQFYDFLDDYTQHRKAELNQRRLQPGSGLLKTYVIETSHGNQSPDIPTILENIGWENEEFDQGLYEVSGFSDSMNAYVDILTDRFLLIYSVEKSPISDAQVKRAVRNSKDLDHAWFTSPILSTIWQEFISPDRLHRYALLRAETEPRFEDLSLDSVDDYEQDDDDESEENLQESATSRIEIKYRLSFLREHFGSNGKHAELIRNLIRIRVPGNKSGRYDFYSWGKSTDRGDDFRSYKVFLEGILKLYQSIIVEIEKTASLSFESPESHPIEEHNHLLLQGSPVTFVFSKPLSESVFSKFVESTIEKGSGPFRLWGNPIRLGESKVHVYGLDLHLWQPLHLDLSPSRFIVILPKGTCGNTVHRLMVNIGRFLDPDVTTYIGLKEYHQVVQQALRNL